jgi:hypothetical protein
MNEAWVQRGWATDGRTMGVFTSDFLRVAATLLFEQQRDGKP